jgi:hypothetical protein
MDAMARLPRSPTTLAGSFVAAKLLEVSTMMLENMTKADSSKKRRIILNLQRHGSASAFRLRLTCAPEEGSRRIIALRIRIRQCDDESARRSRSQIGLTPKLCLNTRLNRQSFVGYAEITDFTG